MKPTVRTIPSMSMLALTFAGMTSTTNFGCSLFTDPIVNTWEASEVGGYSLPFSYVVNSECLVTFEDGTLVISGDDRLSAKFDVSYTFDCPGESLVRGKVKGDGDVDVIERGTEYDISLEGDIELDLSCTLRGDSLDCSDDNDADWKFDSAQ